MGIVNTVRDDVSVCPSCGLSGGLSAQFESCVAEVVGADYSIGDSVSRHGDVPLIPSRSVAYGHGRCSICEQDVICDIYFSGLVIARVQWPSLMVWEGLEPLSFEFEEYAETYIDLDQYPNSRLWPRRRWPDGPWPYKWQSDAAKDILMAPRSGRTERALAEHDLAWIEKRASDQLERVLALRLKPPPFEYEGGLEWFDHMFPGTDAARTAKEHLAAAEHDPEFLLRWLAWHGNVTVDVLIRDQAIDGEPTAIDDAIARRRKFDLSVSDSLEARYKRAFAVLASTRKHGELPPPPFV